MEKWKIPDSNYSVKKTNHPTAPRRAAPRAVHQPCIGSRDPGVSSIWRPKGKDSPAKGERVGTDKQAIE